MGCWILFSSVKGWNLVTVWGFKFIIAFFFSRKAVLIIVEIGI